MLALAERVDRTILRHSLLPSDARVLVAVSGGADSTALAYLLVELGRGRSFGVVGVAHFNHRLRGSASDEDERFCRRLADQLGVSWRSGSGDAAGRARSCRLSLEEACRALRYEFLVEAARELRATHVAVGHTRDDQAETVLLQLFRGAGPRGRRAMAPSRWLDAQAGVRLVRPLLDVSHQELLRWLQARSIPFREDESNRDVRFLRNRLRHEVLPFLEQRVTASVSRVLARDAAIAAADDEYLDRVAGSAYERLSTRSGEHIELDIPALLDEPRAIAARVGLLALGHVAASRFAGFDQAQRLLDLAGGVIRGPVALPGATARVAAGRLVLSRAAARVPRGPDSPYTTVGMNFSRRVLSTPGEAVLPGTGWRVSCLLRPWAGASEPGWSRAEVRDGSRRAVVDASRVSGLAVRPRRPGDAFRPLGLGGRKKLQDYFVDRKVPREDRDRVPLVVDDRDRIVWVAGHGIDEAFRVRPDTRDVIILELRGESA